MEIIKSSNYLPGTRIEGNIYMTDDDSLYLDNTTLDGSHTPRTYRFFVNRTNSDILAGYFAGPGFQIIGKKITLVHKETRTPPDYTGSSHKYSGFVVEKLE